MNWLTDWMVFWQINWLIDWVVFDWWLIEIWWLIDWLVGSLIEGILWGLEKNLKSLCFCLTCSSPCSLEACLDNIGGPVASTAEYQPSTHIVDRVAVPHVGQVGQLHVDAGPIDFNNLGWPMRSRDQGHGWNILLVITFPHSKHFESVFLPNYVLRFKII